MAETHKKVDTLHLITGLDIGGAEMMLLKLMEAQHPGTEVQVCSLTHRKMLNASFEKIGKRVAYFHFDSDPATCISELYRFVVYIKQLSPKKVISWMYHANLATTVIKWIKPSVEVYWGVRVDYPYASKHSLDMQIVNRLSAVMSHWVPSRILYNTKRGIEIHQKKGYASACSALFHNGFDVERFKPCELIRSKFRFAYDLDGDCLLIGMVANYHRRKNVGLFINVAARIAKKRNDVCFVLAGKGMDDENLELTKCISQHADLRRRFLLLGVQDCLENIYPALDIFCLTSFYEGFPNVVGEAMACGVPCVTTDTGDTAYVVGDTGKVVSGFEVKDFEFEVFKMIDQGSEYRRSLGIAARQRVEGQFSIGEAAKRLDQITKGQTCRQHEIV